jgi:uncharacterized protein (TIGR02145 family)
MKRLLVYLLLLIAHSSFSQQDSVIQDINHNKYAVKLFPDGNLWITTNLSVNMLGSYCYENKAENCNQYGRLYTYTTAKEVCIFLGNGWRLPTADEWYRLAASFSPGSQDSNAVGQNGYNYLLATGASTFNALLGGGRTQTGEYARINDHGFYWTATETDSDNATFANFAGGRKTLFLQTEGEKDRAFSVRCIKSGEK